jgi:pimeloyl-ACP methyl ester carboxylesterase
MKSTHHKNAKITFSDTGKGTTIVLVHGFLENLKMWNAFIPELSEKHRVIAIDLLGHGGSECLGYVHTMEDQADMVHQVLMQLKIKKAVFIGHSMGGYVALAFAELYPEAMKGLVLLNSTSKADSHERKINRNRAIKAVKQNYAAFVSLSIANLFSEANRECLANEIVKVREQALQTPLQGIIAALEGMKVRKDRERLLHSVNFPVLLILGEKDGVLNYQDSLEQIKGTEVQLVVFPDGHMSHIENETDVKRVLLAFLKKV